MYCLCLGGITVPSAPIEAKAKAFYVVFGYLWLSPLGYYKGIWFNVLFTVGRLVTWGRSLGLAGPRLQTGNRGAGGWCSKAGVSAP